LCGFFIEKILATWCGPSERRFVRLRGNLAMSPGRKPADESQATAIRTRLVSWQQAPEEQRPSLRALAEELGTTHQLLSFYLKGLDGWQQQEYHRKAQQIRDKGLGMTYADEQQMLAYERAALSCMLSGVLGRWFNRISADKKAGRLTGKQIEIVKLAARKGFPTAKKLLAILKE
jgi:hypothetical protein